MMPVETDSESGIQTYQLVNDPRPTCNIYGEQPYSSSTGDRIAVQHYVSTETADLSILDIKDNAPQPRIALIRRNVYSLPFHAWGKHIYYSERVRDAVVLKRCNYQTLKNEEVLVLPKVDGDSGSGTVSQDERWYAVNVHRDEKSSQLLLIDLANGHERILASGSGYVFSHEQFSRDGRNRILIQAYPHGVRGVNLGSVDVDKGCIDWLPVGAPPLANIGRWPVGDRRIPPGTGHEAWIGQTDRVFFSTRYDPQFGANIWSAASTDKSATVVCNAVHKFCHVSVSKCGNFWLADTFYEEGIPIYMGSFSSGVYCRLVYSRTRPEGENTQWSHTHPYLTADNRWLIFNSNRSGHPQVYGARIQDDFLAKISRKTS